VVGAISIAAALGGGAWYLAHRGLETTDDAQVDADMVSVPARTSGQVIKVAFVENQPVKAGDLLAEIDPEPAAAKLAQAEAALEAAKASAEAADAEARVAETNARGNKSAAEASVQGARSSVSATRDQVAEAEAGVAAATATRDRLATDLDRIQHLVAAASLPEAELDRAKATYDAAAATVNQAQAHLAAVRASTTQAFSRVEEASAKLAQTIDVDAFITLARARAHVAHAQVRTAQAARDLAALDVSYTHIVAPQDGVVSKKTIAVGQMVGPGQGIVQLVPSQQLWVTGNFKETQLTHMRVGQPARIAVDAFPRVSIPGEVESFSAATGARFSLLPPDNATGNFTKVVQRVPVRVRFRGIPDGIVLRAGMSVDLSVDTLK
jgi:membrane fusion protein (multidrug efflux system)